MELALNTRSRQILFLTAVLLPVTLFLLQSIRSYLATYFSHASDPAHLQLAVSLARGNAETHEILGNYYFRVLNDVQSAAKEYQTATNLNPYDARYWLALASTDQVLADTVGQRVALQHAITVDPTTPSTAREAANFFLSQGETHSALREFKVVVANQPSTAYSVFQPCLRAAKVEAVIREVLPPDPTAYFSLLELLMSAKDTAGAGKVWAALVSLNKPFEARLSMPYVDYLIAEHEIAQARAVWRELAILAGLSAYLPARDNLILNPRFDSDILNAGFDWRYEQRPNLELSLDPAESYVSRRSLLIIFDGPGVDRAGIEQLIPVEPSTTYEFSVHYKSDGIMGAGGPVLNIEDAYTAAPYLRSDDLRDTSIWREVSGTFKTGADSQLLRLQVLRVPALAAIRGKLWLDDFQLASKDP